MAEAEEGVMYARATAVSGEIVELRILNSKRRSFPPEVMRAFDRIIDNLTEEAA